MKKNIVIASVVGIVCLAGGFFGGMKYGQGKGITAQSLANMSASQRQQLLQEMRSSGGNLFTGGNGTRRQGSQAQGNAFINGQIINKDDKSITVKSQDGSSKIVFLSGSSQVTKSTSGSVSDLSVGNEVVVNGNSNSDGSMTANLIQLRPQAAQQQVPQ